jgi:hypothetical protein
VRAVAGALLAAALGALAAAPTAAAQTAPPAAAQAAAPGEAPTIAVRYRSADTVYLDAGRAAGLAEGERIEVVRDGEVVAVLEVVFLAEHSASARVVEASGEVREGDRVRRLAGAPPPPAEDTPPSTTLPPPRRVVRTPPRPERAPSTRLYGTVTADWEGFADGGESERDWQRTTVGVRLTGRDLGGLPLGVRVRLRADQFDRDRPYRSGVVPDRESRDRLYELALSWEPPEGRWAVRAGRLGTSPYAGLGATAQCSRRRPSISSYVHG